MSTARYAISSELLQKIIKWLPKQRWFPKKGRISIEEAVEIPGEKNLLLLQLSVDGSEVFLPLILDKEKPGIEASLIKVQDRYIYEAEFSAYYFEKLFRDEIGVLEKRGFKPLPQKIASIEALSRSSTNRLIKLNTDLGPLVAKCYRTLTSENQEPLFLSYLSGEYTPEVYAYWEVKGKPIATLMEYVKILEDAGAAFYKAACITIRRKRLQLPHEHAIRVARFVAGFHEKMAECDNAWCKPEKISINDIVDWEKRIASYGNLMRRELRLLNIPGLERKAVARINEAIKILKQFSGLIKIRTHQDLHLGQIAVTPNQLFILDFEGEPLRKYRVEKEPCLRDIACLLRSLVYIAFSAYKNFLRKSNQSVFKAFIKGKAVLMSEWYQAVFDAILESYLESLSIEKVLGESLEKDEVKNLLLPWLVERSCYEFAYEAKYRPENRFIPLLGLVTF